MKCCLCGRSIKEAAALTKGGEPLGPTCATKPGVSDFVRKQKKGRRKAAQKNPEICDKTLDLFADLD